MPMGRGTISRARARKAAAVEQDVQSEEQPGDPEEKIPNSLPGAGDIQSDVPMFPAQASERFEGPNLTVNMGEKTLTVMKTRYLRPSPMRYLPRYLPIHSPAKMSHHWVHSSPRSHQSYHKVTHHRQVLAAVSTPLECRIIVVIAGTPPPHKANGPQTHPKQHLPGTVKIKRIHAAVYPAAEDASFPEAVKFPDAANIVVPQSTIY